MMWSNNIPSHTFIIHLHQTRLQKLRWAALTLQKLGIVVSLEMSCFQYGWRFREKKQSIARIQLGQCIYALCTVAQCCYLLWTLCSTKIRVNKIKTTRGTKTNNTRHFRLVVLCKDVRVCKGHQYLIGTQVQLCCLLLVCFQLLAERYRV